MYRTPSPYQWRKVTTSEESMAWWDQLSAMRVWYLTLECGHYVVRRRRKCPARVRCDGCPL